MHPPTVADGRLNVSKLYKPPVPMPSEWNLEKIEPGTDNPEKVRPADSRLGTFRPQEIVMSAPQKTPASALPQARPPLPTRFSSSPSKTISAQVSAIPVDPATKLPHMNTLSFPITQHFPVPGPFPGPSTPNQLRSRKSISVLADGRHVDYRPRSTLVASQSSLALNMWNRDPPQLGLGLSSITPASTSNASGLWSQQTPLPSSLLNAKQTQPPPHKVEKPRFFSRLFFFGKSKYKEPTAPQPTKKLTKSTASARPISTISENATNSIGPRQRAVLVKKSAASHPARHSRPPSLLTRPGSLSPRQNYAHPLHDNDPQPTYPQLGNSEIVTPSQVVNHASSISFSHMNSNYTTTPTNPTHPADPTPSTSNQPYGTYHVQGLVTAPHTQYPGMDNHHDRYPSSSNPHHSAAQDSGYQSLAATPGPILCTVCNMNPQYTQPTTGEIFPYCSDVCRAAATPQTQPACSYPGCTHPAVLYPLDHYWNYCSESHERYARKGCISCRQDDDNGTQLCKRCKETFKRHGPTIIPVPMDHDAFWHVVDKFSGSWTNPTQCPIFQAARVYRIVLTQDRRDTYLGYRDTLEYYGRFTAKGKSNGNERILWHGTRRGCNLGETGKSVTDTPIGRFGTGIYTFTKAFKASECSSNDKNVATPWVAVLLSKVAAGHECVMRHDNTTLTTPPQGYDSVIGEVRGRLNYDELVVYTYDAIRPTWLVMYQQK